MTKEEIKKKLFSMAKVDHCSILGTTRVERMFDLEADFIIGLLSEQQSKHEQEMKDFAEWKARVAKRNKDLFGEIVPNTYFKAVTSKNDDGWMQCDCGNSGIDGEDHYVVTTHNLKGDEVPDLCHDSKTFAELVARLLNKHYNS